MPRFDFDLFRIDDRGEPIWVGVVKDIESAKRLANTFPPGTQFLLYDCNTSKKVLLDSEVVGDGPLKAGA